MILLITCADSDMLVALTAGTGFFKPLELETMHEVLDDYHTENRELGHRAFAWDEAGRILGYIYHAPTPMTDRSWHLYWIAIDQSQQGRGLGGKLLEFVEKDVRDQAGRLLLIETSTTPHYEPTRRFYRKYGYTPAARIPDYHSDGNGMTVFTKRIATSKATVNDGGE